MKVHIRVVLAAALFVLAAGYAQAATTLMEIGRSPFHMPPLKSASELIDMVQSKAAEVEKGFALAGRSDLSAPFIEQISQVEIVTKEYSKGTYFPWMFYKKKGKGTVKVVRDVTWGNVKTFAGFELVIAHEGMNYTFVVPLGCGNIALMEANRIAVAQAPPPPPEPVVPPPPPNQRPSCSVSVSSVRAFCGEIITIDGSGSSDPDGTVESMTIAFVDDTGRVVSEKVVDGGGLVANEPMPCGNSTLRVVVVDDDGADASSESCNVELFGKPRIGYLADFGYYRQHDPGNYLFGRVGAEYALDDYWSIIGMIGGAPHVDGSDGKSAFMLDLLVEYEYSRFFVNLGAGAWLTGGDSDNKAEDDQLDLIAILGARVYGEPDEFNASLFLEARSGVDEIDEFSDFGRFGFGIRFRF